MTTAFGDRYAASVRPDGPMRRIGRRVPDVDGLQAAGVTGGIPNVWCTGPGSAMSVAFWGGIGSGVAGTAKLPYSYLNCFIAEVIGTAALLWGILASGDSKNTGLMHNLGPFLVGGTVLAIGLSLGGPSG